MNNLNAVINDEGDFFESVARVIHDINSPIATIEMCLFLLAQEVQSDTLSIIKSALQNVRDITHNFHARHYAKKQNVHSIRKSRNLSDQKVARSQSINLKLLIDSVIAEKRFEWHERQHVLSFICSSAFDNSTIQACAVEIKRMISNLLNNAIEACIDDAHINLALKNENSFLCLSITDNGTGMASEKVKSHLEGESTKHSEKGLGLSGAKIVMENLGGKIFVSSQIGTGTIIKLHFPTSMR